MKHIITAILLMVSVSCYSQDSTYNNIVKFNMTDSVEFGITFQRKAFFEAMIYNQRVNSISMQWRVEFYNTDGSKKMKLVKPYVSQIVINNDQYVVSATGAYVGNEAQMLALYGTYFNNGNDSGYVKNPGSQFYQLSTPCMGYYDYITKGFDGTKNLHQTIKNIGQAAAEGKLQ